jgi:hypothetical protein
VNQLGDEPDTIKKSTETLVDASNEVDLKVHADVALSSPGCKVNL